MNTQDQSPKNNTELNDAPSRVTPEASRTVLPSDTLKANYEDFPFLSLSVPFFASSQRLEPRAELVSQDEDRCADLLLALPRQRISLQRRALSHARAPLKDWASTASEITTCPPTPIMSYALNVNEEEEKKLSSFCATPEQPRKRQRLSSPPALPHGADACREPMPFAPGSRVPNNLLLPSF